MNGNGRPLSMRKKVQLLVILTIMAWATQTLMHQWGYGAESLPARAPEQPADDAQPAAEKFVPGSARFTAGATLELRAEATIYGPEVKLKQLCRWADADAALFVPVADLVLARFDGKAPYQAVSLDEVKRTLHDAGVNLAVVRFAGPMQCTVTRSDAPADPKNALAQWIDAREGKVAAAPEAKSTPTAVVPSTRPTGVVGANVATSADGTPVRSLRQLLTDDLAVRLNLAPDLLQINFNPKDERVLNLAEPQFRFNLEPMRVRNLGDVAWDVLVVAETGTQKVSIGATARAWETQVVVNKPLAPRQVIRDSDVVERRTLVERTADEPRLTLAQSVGQQASRDLKPGTVLTGRLVDPVPLAKNGQFVTVTLDRGGVRVKTVGRAMEGGSFGQNIKVKNEATGDIYDVILTAPQEGTIGQVPTGGTREARFASIRE